MAESVVAVDVGTSLVKAVRYDDGVEAAVAGRPVAVDRPAPGRAEQDMEAVWEAVVAVLREVTSGRGERPVAVAVTGQGDGAWLVDAAGRPTGPAVLWNDGRAHDVVRGWYEDGVGPSRPSPGMSAPLLAWFARHDRDRLEASVTLLSCTGWVLLRLTGCRWVEASDAAPLVDLATDEWSEAALAGFGVEAHRRLLPPVVRALDAVAPLHPHAAAATGLPVGTPVVLAPYDVAATAIGAGALQAGDAVCVLGTTLATEVVLDHRPVVDLATVGTTVALGAPQRWLRCLPTMSGGDALAWVAELLGVTDVPALLALAATGRPHADGVRFLPHLSPAGERAPFVDPRARGSLTGLSLEATRGDVARAALEGLSLTVRECLDLATGDAAPPTHLTVCGGGAADPLWVGVLAETCDVVVRRCRDRQVGARGAMLVAEVATGLRPDLPTAAAAYVVLDDVAGPTTAAQPRWHERREEHGRLRATLTPTWGDR